MQQKAKEENYVQQRSSDERQRSKTDWLRHFATIFSNKISVRSLNICTISIHCNYDNENRHTNQCPPLKRGCDKRDYAVRINGCPY